MEKKNKEGDERTQTLTFNLREKEGFGTEDTHIFTQIQIPVNIKSQMSLPNSFYRWGGKSFLLLELSPNA